MSPLQALQLGFVEGVTEYLPISSTFHLIWASKLLGLPQNDFQKAFEVIIQSGAILAIIFLYWTTFKNNRELLIKLGTSFIPTALIGFALYKIIKQIFFENILLQLGVFIGVGIGFILFEQIHKRTNNRSIATISLSEALLVGIVQSLAVIPGVSRAGAVILILMFLGIRRNEAAKYSFFLAVPTLLAASALDIVKTYPLLLVNQNMLILVIGFFTAFISALFTVKWFVSFLQNHTLSSFGLYRLAMGLIIIFLFGRATG